MQHTDAPVLALLSLIVQWALRLTLVSRRDWAARGAPSWLSRLPRMHTQDMYRSVPNQHEIPLRQTLSQPPLHFAGWSGAEKRPYRSEWRRGPQGRKGQ